MIKKLYDDFQWILKKVNKIKKSWILIDSFLTLFPFYVLSSSMKRKQHQND